MNKQISITHGGMTQDSAKTKFQNKYYFEGRNIRITSSDSNTTGAVTNDKGNELLLKIPELKINTDVKEIQYNNKTLVYKNLRIEKLFKNPNINNQKIVGNTSTKNGFVFFTSNNNGFDCLWELEEHNLELTLLYVGNFNFKYSLPVQILNNFENNKIDKIYFINGSEQMRFLNLRHSVKNNDLEELIDLDESILNIVSDVILTDPKIEELNYGGVHTSGMIQYAYSYYKINGAQSRLSPMSELIALGKTSLKGGNLNEIVGTIPKVHISEIDPNFTNLRLYSIKYTSFNELPTISLIADRDISGVSDFTYFDDGRIIQSVTIEEIVFLTNGFVIPKHIESKDNRLFMFNYKDRIFNLNFKENKLDTRAYSFKRNYHTTSVCDQISSYPIVNNDFTVVNDRHINGDEFLPFDHSAINSDYDIQKYQFQSSIVGGEGPFLKYSIIRSFVNKNETGDLKFFKEGELYRIGIQFYNRYGIKSTPSWIADFIVSSDRPEEHNLNGYYAGLNIEFKPSFYVWLNDPSNFKDSKGEYDSFLKPIGFKILRADRSIADRSIITQGFINGMLSHSKSTGSPPINTAVDWANNGLKVPSLIRTFDHSYCPMFGNETYARLDGRTGHPQWNGGGPSRGAASEEIFSYVKGRRGATFQFNQLMQFYSPEIIFEMMNGINSENFEIVGSALNNYSGVKYRLENWTTGEFENFKRFDNAISGFDYKSKNTSRDYATGFRGIIGPVIIHKNENRKVGVASQYMRDYTGNFNINKNKKTYKVYGLPEITEFNSIAKRYNNDVDLLYTSSMEALVSDVAGDDNDSSTQHTNINRVLASSARSAVFALGDNLTLTRNRPNIENLYNEADFGVTDIPESNKILDYTINYVVSTFEDLIAFGNFNDLNIGVLETGNIYSKNNRELIIGKVDFKNVVATFARLDDYNKLSSTKRLEFVGKRVLIGTRNWDKYFAPSVNSMRIYDVLTAFPSTAGSLVQTTTVVPEIHPQLIGCDRIVKTMEELEAIKNSELPSIGFVGNYRIAVIDDGRVYEWTRMIPTDIYNWVSYGSILSLNPKQDSSESQTSFKNCILVSEFKNTKSLIYTGNYYGGNSFESKLKTVYVEASDYYKFENNQSFNIYNPGDTFVQDYQFGRITKIPYDEIIYNDSLRITEIVKIKLESTVNQNKRNDESTEDWYNSFFPSQGDYHTYNRVYSQNPSLIKSTNLSYEIKPNEEFSTAIISTEIKRPGEVIDSWSKLSVNDTLFVDGKYGEITAVSKLNDEIITFQDSAIAKIDINPRVQLNTSDGVGVHLGTGAVLYDYRYLTTSSGTLNKWGVLNTNSGIIYYDTLNNSIGGISDGVIKLSETKGLHSYLINNVNPKIIKEDNPILNTGVKMGYDFYNNDIYITFLQHENSDTLCYNEVFGEFISLHDFKPSFYFNKGAIFLTSSPELNKIYQHKDGISNIYYDIYKPSYITYSLNPEGGVPCIYNNINYKSEVYNKGVDVPEKTFTHIQAYNEYQNTGLQAFVIGRNGNARRKFRDWNVEIPREGRTRIRNPYTYLKLQFNNYSNDKIIWYDVSVGYTV